jgi:serine/threonine-protein kinase
MSVDDSAKLDADRALVGRTIARKFKLLRLLGAGGMGAVYEAEDLLLGRRVALKLMKAAIASNTALVQRFVREARAADSIQHKNIVRVLDLAADDETGSFYIVQELLSGESLAEKLERERALLPKEAVTIIVAVLDALAAAHERGIVHRDVKPENVFLHREADGTITPKLIDFGISKVAEQQEGLAKTQTGTALGTPYYMSPEQVRGDSSIDHRADQWSAGVMLFELVTGRRPFQGENYNLLILEIMTRRAPRADEVAPGIAPELAAVIARALEPNRDQRFESSRAFRSALEALSLDDTARISRVRDAALARADAPTIDAESAAAHANVALGATLAADGDAAIPLVASPSVSETHAEAIAIAKAQPERELTPVASKRPARGALFAGIALGAIVSVAAAVSVSRSSSGAQRAPQTTERSPTTPSRSTAGLPVNPSIHGAATGAVTTSAPPTNSAVIADSGAPSVVAVNRGPSTTGRVRSPRTNAAASQPAQPPRVATNTQSTQSTQGTQNAQATQSSQPAQNPQSSGATSGTGGGFRPITTYP